MPVKKKKKTSRGPAKSAGKKKATKTAAAGIKTDPKRVAAILKGLDEAYPNAVCELNHEKRISTSYRHNSVSSMYRRPRESSNCDSLQEIPDAGSVRPRKSERARTRYPAHRFLPQQNEIGNRCEQSHPRTIWRKRSAHDGRNAHDSWSCAQDFQRRVGHRLRNRKRRGRGYTRSASFEPAGAHAK